MHNPTLDQTFDPVAYWQWRYRSGGTSGAGSRGRLAAFKAEIVNGVIAANQIRSVIDLGCGDGVQMAMIGADADGPRYLGVDVSPDALALCLALGRGNRRFLLYDDFAAAMPAHTAELAISMDVIYHLTDDAVYHHYLDDLFACAERMVLIYASNINATPRDTHVRHRCFTDTIKFRFPDWRLAAMLPNRFQFDPTQPEQTSFADFYLFAPESNGMIVSMPGSAPIQ
jgi:SAM-dependent methyltransferase